MVSVSFATAVGRAMFRARVAPRPPMVTGRQKVSGIRIVFVTDGAARLVTAAALIMLCITFGQNGRETGRDCGGFNGSPPIGACAGGASSIQPAKQGE